jgi:hypothetical protein
MTVLGMLGTPLLAKVSKGNSPTRLTVAPGQAAAGVKVINMLSAAKTGEPTANATKTTSNIIDIIL